MRHNNTIFNQLLSLIPRYEFDKIVSKYNGDKHTRKFDSWTQFVCVAYGQLRQRVSLRDIQIGLEAQQAKLYHLGVNSVKRSTFSDANKTRDYRIYQDLFHVLLRRCQILTKKKLKIPNPIFSIDATVIRLCHSIFPWTKMPKKKGGIKLHFMMSHDFGLPEFLHITPGTTNDINGAKLMSLPPDSIAVFDKGYHSFAWFNHLHQQGVTFVTRIKENTCYTSIGQHEFSAQESGVLRDEDIVFTKRRKANYPRPLRLVTYYDEQTDRVFKFITNNETFAPETIALIYKQRWQIELFFKWIKQHLKIKTFLGTSQNAVFSQIWIAMCLFLLLKYLKFQTNYRFSFTQLTRVLNEMAFERLSIIDVLFAKHRPDIPLPRDQLAFSFF